MGFFYPEEFQSFEHILRLREGIVTDESVDAGEETIIHGPPMLPVPDGGGGHTEPGSDIFLAKAEFETPPGAGSHRGWRVLGEILKKLVFSG